MTVIVLPCAFWRRAVSRSCRPATRSSLNRRGAARLRRPRAAGQRLTPYGIGLITRDDIRITDETVLRTRDVFSSPHSVMLVCAPERIRVNAVAPARR